MDTRREHHRNGTIKFSHHQFHFYSSKMLFYLLLVPSASDASYTFYTLFYTLSTWSNARKNWHLTKYYFGNPNQQLSTTQGHSQTEIDNSILHISLRRKSITLTLFLYDLKTEKLWTVEKYKYLFRC